MRDICPVFVLGFHNMWFRRMLRIRIDEVFVLIVCKIMQLVTINELLQLYSTITTL